MIYWISLLPVSISYIVHIAYGDQMTKIVIISSDSNMEGFPPKLHAEKDPGRVNVLTFKPQDYQSMPLESNFNNPYQNQNLYGNQVQVMPWLLPNNKISSLNTYSEFKKEDCIPVYTKHFNIYEVDPKGAIFVNELRLCRTKQKDTQYYTVPVPRQYLRNQLVELAQTIKDKIITPKNKVAEDSSSYNERHRDTTNFYAEDYLVSATTDFSNANSLNKGNNWNSGLVVCADSNKENIFNAKPFKTSAKDSFNGRGSQELLEKIRAADLFNTLCALKIVCLVNLNAASKNYDARETGNTMNSFHYLNGFDNMYGDMSPVNVIIIVGGISTVKLLNERNFLDVCKTFGSSSIVKPLSAFGHPNDVVDLYDEDNFSAGGRLMPKGSLDNAGSFNYGDPRSFTKYGGLIRKGLLNDGRSFRGDNNLGSVNHFSRQTPSSILSHGSSLKNRGYLYGKDYLRPRATSNTGFELKPRESLYPKRGFNAGSSLSSTSGSSFLKDAEKNSVLGDKNGILSVGESYLTRKPLISKFNLVNGRGKLIPKDSFNDVGSINLKESIIASGDLNETGHLSGKFLSAKNSFNKGGSKSSEGSLNDAGVLGVLGGSSSLLSTGGGYVTAIPVFRLGGRSTGSGLNAGGIFNASNDVSAEKLFRAGKGFYTEEAHSGKNAMVSEGSLNVTGGLNASDIVNGGENSNTSGRTTDAAKDNIGVGSDIVGGWNTSSVVSTGKNLVPSGGVSSTATYNMSDVSVTDNTTVSVRLDIEKGVNASDAVSPESAGGSLNDSIK